VFVYVYVCVWLGLGGLGFTLHPSPDANRLSADAKRLATDANRPPSDANTLTPDANELATYANMLHTDANSLPADFRLPTDANSLPTDANSLFLGGPRGVGSTALTAGLNLYIIHLPMYLERIPDGLARAGLLLFASVAVLPRRLLIKIVV